MTPLAQYERLKALHQHAEDEALARLRRVPALSTPVTDPEDRLAIRLANVLGEAVANLSPLAREAEQAEKETV